uniref:ABA3 n=1 Tax=Arundo donax TaxID=35708 RepID=A0A0A9DPW5_ARUDO
MVQVHHPFQPLELGGPHLVDAPGRVRVAVVPAELLQELRLALLHLHLSLPPLHTQILASNRNLR